MFNLNLNKSNKQIKLNSKNIKNNNSPSLSRGLRVGALTITIASLGLFGCQNINKPTVGAAIAAEPEMPEMTAAESEMANVTATELNDSLEDYIDDTVTIRGEIESRFTTDSFIIRDDRIFGGEEILVINDTGENFTFPADTNAVMVTGEVKRLYTTDLNTRISWNLQIDRLKTYEGKPVIMASSIHAAPSIDAVTDTPTNFYGQSLSLQGEVGQIVNLNSFMLKENKLFGAGEILIIDATNGEAVGFGEIVAVSGELRPFVVTEINEEFNLDWDLELQRSLEVEYTNKPVLIADEVIHQSSK
jgi:uncharacterized protein YdeI (BOF family)